MLFVYWWSIRLFIVLVGVFKRVVFVCQNDVVWRFELSDLCVCFECIDYFFKWIVWRERSRNVDFYEKLLINMLNCWVFKRYGGKWLFNWVV